MAFLAHPATLAPSPLLSSSFHPPRIAAISELRRGPAAQTLRFRFLGSRCARVAQSRPLRLAASGAGNPEAEEEEEKAFVEDLRVPDAWLIPSNAKQESEWLRVALHKWLDDEYCPEPTNEEISKVAARSFYESLMDQQSDLGEILLKMVHDLKAVSFRESFHGVFSSANAAVHLITSRMNSLAGM